MNYPPPLPVSCNKDCGAGWPLIAETKEGRFVDTHGRNELFGLPNVDDDEDEEEEDTKSRKKKQSAVEPIPDSRSTTSWRYVRETPVLGKVEQPIVSDEELLTMRTEEARAYGFSKATLNDREAVSDYFNITGAIDKQSDTESSRRLSTDITEVIIITTAVDQQSTAKQTATE